MRPVLWSLLLCIGGLLIGGCDGAGSQRASLYERLTGTGAWTVERLEGGINYTPQLNDRYPEGVTIKFRDSENGRTYRIAAPRAEDSTEVIAEGIVTLRRNSGLEMSTGFGPRGPVVWTYRFEASRAIFSLRFGSRAFLRALFSGESQDQSLEMTLAPTEE
jgi:hypothetical protein